MARVAPSTMAFACATTCSSSPTSSGRISRCDAKYGARKVPMQRDDREQQRESSACRARGAAGSRRAEARGSGRRRASSAGRRTARSRSRRGSRGSRSEGARPRGRRPSSSAEPVVWRTNHGSARKVICDPSDEMTSAETSAKIGRWRSGLRACVRAATHRPAGRPRRRARSACRACRRSLTMSQWMRDSFVPPMSGMPLPEREVHRPVDLLVEQRVAHVPGDARVAADAELAEAPRPGVGVEHLDEVRLVRLRGRVDDGARPRSAGGSR